MKYILMPHNISMDIKIREEKKEIEYVNVQLELLTFIHQTIHNISNICKNNMCESMMCIMECVCVLYI